MSPDIDTTSWGDQSASVLLEPDPKPEPPEFAMIVMESNGEIVEQFTGDEMVRLAKIWRRLLDTDSEPSR